jgi:phosphohistidine phosphatase
MDIYIFRHAVADFGAKPHDDDPHITKKSASDAAETIGIASKNFGFKPNVVVSSPLVRARETATITRKKLGIKSGVVVDECLHGDKKPADVFAFLTKFKKTDRLVLVSHMPLIFELLYDMIGGRAEVELLNGSIACVQFKGLASRGKGKLVWLVPPPV